MGDDANIINDIANGCHPFADKLKNAKRPVIIVGSDQLARKDGAAILGALHKFANSLNKEV